VRKEKAGAKKVGVANRSLRFGDILSLGYQYHAVEFGSDGKKLNADTCMV
jgi:hypothetical protein